MSSLLRSSKFVRYFTGAARSLIPNSPLQEANIVDSSRSLLGFRSRFRDYSSERSIQNLDPLLQRLDSDVRRLGRITRKDIDGILDEIRQKYAITSSQSLLIIRCCGELVPEELPAERTQLVQKIWSVLEQRRVPLDISHYNALLRVYIENKHQFSPANFLEDLEKKGIQPNRVTYQRLMWSYCQAGNVEGAAAVLERMRALGLPVSEAVLNALVMGHASHGDAAGARAVLAAMAGAGLQPSAATFALLAAGLARDGDLPAVRAVLKDCADNDLFLSDKDLMEIVEALAANGHTQLIDEMLSEMQRGKGYNQDAINLIFRLLNQGLDEAAIKMLGTLVKSPVQLDPNLMDFQGAFFAKHLVKVASAERVVTLCRTLQNNGQSPKALSIAAEEALNIGKPDIALALLKEMKADGAPIRQHYFWPILCSYGNKEDKQGLLKTLASMVNEFEIAPSMETVREYAMPYLSGSNNAIQDLYGSGVRPWIVARCAMMGLLQDHDLKGAAAVARDHYISGQSELFANPAAVALLKTGDVDSYVQIVQILSDAEGRKTQTDEEKSDSVDAKEKIGRMIHSAVVIAKNELELIGRLLEALESQGLGFNANWASRIQETLGSQLSSKLSEQLSKLATVELDPEHLKPATSRPRIRNADLIEKLISQVDDSKSGALKRELISSFMRENQTDKLKDHLQKLQAEHYVLTSGTLAQIISYFARQNDLESALKYKGQLFERDPDFLLDNTKSMQLAQCMIETEKYDDALEFLKTVSVQEDYNDSFLVNTAAWQLLNNVAEKRDAQTAEKLTNVLVERKFVMPSNLVFGSVMKAHLLADDLDKALDAFEMYCSKYKCTPWKAELTRRLIQKEDASRLQRLTDMSTTVHGEINSLYDLVFAFVECGRLKQARRILETPGLRSRSHRINDACQRYEQEGKIEHLEGLVEATRELSFINRSELFYHLLVGYCKADNSDKALGLWTLLQEEDVPPTDKFLLHLADYLKSKNIDIPFVVPQVQEEEKQIETPKQTIKKEKKAKTEKKTKSVSILEEIKTLIEAQKLDDAVDITKKLKTSDSEFRDAQSLVIHGLLNDNRIEDATKLTKAMLKEKMIPFEMATIRLIRALADAKNVQDLEEIGTFLSNKQKTSFSFDNKVTVIKFRLGQAESYITDLEKEMNGEKSPEEWLALNHKFPRVASLTEIRGDQNLNKRLAVMADKFASHGIMAPVNALWMDYLISGSKQQADDIWNKYLADSKVNIHYRPIMQYVYDTQNVELAREVIEKLNSNKNMSFGAKENIFSRLIDLYLVKDDIENAQDTLREVVKQGVKVENLEKRTIQRLKEAVEKSGRKYEF